MNKKLRIIVLILAISVICLQIAMPLLPAHLKAANASDAHGYFAILDEAEEGWLGTIAGLNIILAGILSLLVIYIALKNE